MQAPARAEVDKHRRRTLETLMPCLRARVADGGVIGPKLVEARMARQRGYELGQALGVGMHGRVYRATNAYTGEQVAIKVVEILPSQRRQMAQVRKVQARRHTVRCNFA